MNFDFAPILTRLHDMWQASIRIIPNLVIALLVFGLSLLVARLASRMVGTLVKRAGQPQSIVLLFTRIASRLVRGLGALIAMTIVVPTLTAASLFGALGVTGIAIGFAFKDIFQNLLAGMLILITRPFRIGDQIVSGSHEGTVEDIQVRATLLRTYDNRCVVIPNGELYTSRVVVNTAYETIRIGVAVGIGYGDDIEQAKQVALTTLEGLKGILRDPPPKVLVRALGDFSVNLEIRFWINPPGRREVVEAEDLVLAALKSRLVEAGIDLPMPTQQVLFHDQTEETDGDRSRQRGGCPARGDNDPRPREAMRAAAARSGRDAEDTR